MSYQTTIGLEIHVELKTKTKMFCGCKNQSVLEAKPNSNICPICMGHPGTLPVINKEAVKHVLKVGVALDGQLAEDFSEFDRKNYFYPDIPKGYQISQYKYPLVKGGSLNGVAITRVHLEEDTARSTHEGEDYSLVDFNRAGVPLMELVTEPVIKSAKEASDFAKELQLLLRTLDVADAEMSRGEMRVEANISVSMGTIDTKNGKELGTKVEVKNLNSFKSVERAIEYEVSRHIELLENGKKIVQETRGWDESKQKTFSQRQKEESHDYRYFPDPDLPKLKLKLIKEFTEEEIKKSLQELPQQKRERYISKYQLSEQHANFFSSEPAISKYFDDVISGLKDITEIQLASNYIAVDLVGLSQQQYFKTFPESEDLISLIKMIKIGQLSSRGAKDILAILVRGEKGTEKIAEEKSLIQKNNREEIEEMLKKIISNNPKVVTDYKAGKESAIMFFVGQVMKESKESANPALIQEIAEKLLKN